MKILGTITDLVTLAIRKVGNVYSSTISENATAPTANRTIELPPGTPVALVGDTSTQTLTNKTITSPVGIVKGDVGLGNVDNTSNITERAATATLTNKTITSPVGIVKGDVGLGNVDNTSDANKPVSTAQAAANVTDRDRANHTGTQTASTVSDFNPAVATTAALKGANADITSLSGLTTALSIPQGGTGQITANAAVNALLPSQTSAVNRFLRTDGSNTSWASAGGGVGKNYLQDQYDADASISVQQSVGDVLASSTRLNPTFFGSSSAVSNLISVSADTSLRPTNNYLIAFTANAQFIETPLFSLDGIDLGKAMSVAFSVTGVGASDDVQTYMARYNSSNVLQERIPIAGIASATTPNSARVPTGTTNFRGFFIPSSTAGDKYALRVLRNANSTSMRVDALVVGPSSIQTGTAITDWQSYTPTWTSTGTQPAIGNGSINGKYRRSGSNIELQVKITPGSTSTYGTGNYLISIPSGFTIDSSSYPGFTSFSDDRITPTGIWSITDSGSAIYQVGHVCAASSTTFSFLIGAATTQTATNWSTTVPFTFGNGDLFQASMFAPITGWSSNVTMADRAVEEYAWNSDTTNNPTTTSGFSNGPEGVFIGSYSTTTKAKRVRFQTATQATDIVSLEINNNGQWIPLGGLNLVIQGGSRYGMQLAVISSTDYDVSFMVDGARPTSATYASGGEAWSGYTTVKWRVRKVSGGAAVGYPIGARNVIGDVSGTAVPAGYIGETITVDIISSVGTVSANTAVDCAQTLTLPTAGVWKIEAAGQARISTAAGRPTGPAYGHVQLTDSANTQLDVSLMEVELSASKDTSQRFYLSAVVSISVATTYKLRALCNEANSLSLMTIRTTTATFVGSVANKSRWIATRIA